MFIVSPYWNVGYVANPQTIGRHRQILPCQVGEHRKTMCRVCCAWFSHFMAHLESVLVNDIFKPVAPKRVVAIKVAAIHMPQFHSAYSGILAAYPVYVGYGKLLLGDLGKLNIFIVLVICLLRNAKQLAEALNLIAASISCMQVFYCSAPAFFRIDILNCFSATLISSS